MNILLLFLVIPALLTTTWTAKHLLLDTDDKKSEPTAGSDFKGENFNEFFQCRSPNTQHGARCTM